VKTPSSRNLRHILCATDLSARSTAAWLRAASLARLTGARLTVLHVIDSEQSERVARMRANRAYVDSLSQADRVFGSAAGFIDVVVRRGSVRHVIASTAQEWDADLIVVIGSVADRLLRAAPVRCARNSVSASRPQAGCAQSSRV
jgi:nucleotide-binding universal stress UspA family protein